MVRGHKDGTTRGGKMLNPTDYYRKQQRKKEIDKNKKERKQVRTLASVRRDPQAIRVQIRELDGLEAQGKLEKRGRAKRRELQELLEKAMQKRKEEDQAASEMVTAQPKTKRALDKSNRSMYPNPEGSIYYDPVLNPFGAPPPGQPALFKEQDFEDPPQDSSDLPGISVRTERGDEVIPLPERPTGSPPPPSGSTPGPPPPPPPGPPPNQPSGPGLVPRAPLLPSPPMFGVQAFPYPPPPPYPYAIPLAPPVPAPSAPPPLISPSLVPPPPPPPPLARPIMTAPVPQRQLQPQPHVQPHVQPPPAPVPAPVVSFASKPVAPPPKAFVPTALRIQKQAPKPKPKPKPVAKRSAAPPPPEQSNQAPTPSDEDAFAAFMSDMKELGAV